jgi:hypothetical protein
MMEQGSGVAHDNMKWDFPGIPASHRLIGEVGTREYVIEAVGGHCLHTPEHVTGRWKNGREMAKADETE